MRKFLFALFLIVAAGCFPTRALAAGNILVSPNPLTIEVGSSATFTITATNTVGDVAIHSSDANIAQVNMNNWGTGMVDENQTKTGTVTVTGVREGNAMITLTLDAATFDGEDLSGQTRSVSVSVVPKPAPVATPAPTPTPAPSTPVYRPVNNTPSTNTQTSTPNPSTNNKFKEISVEGHQLNMVDDNNYSLIVKSDVASITINAVAEDAKAQVSGTGEHELATGENKFEVIVTSESGEENKINILVTRRGELSAEDTDTTSDDTQTDDTDDTKLPKKSSNLVLNLIIIAVVIAGSATVVVYFVKRK